VADDNLTAVDIDVVMKLIFLKAFIKMMVFRWKSLGESLLNVYHTISSNLAAALDVESLPVS
jgi:hypothetical protein